IVRAVHSLVKHDYKIQFLIVGPDRSGDVVQAEIETYIADHNLGDNCTRIEHTSQPELYFKIADVFILNSSFEGLSNSLLEAMATGLPCVASPASGTVDLVENNVNGFLTDGSSKQIEEKITALYNNKSLYSSMSKEARKKIVQRYSVDFVLREHLELFKQN